MLKGQAGESDSGGNAAGSSLRWWRIGWMLGVLALYAAGLGVVYASGLSDRYYRVDVVSIWMWPVCWGAGLVLYGSLAARLVTEYFSNMIDPSCRVWLRERDGLFARRTLVWERVEANCPVRVAFSEGDAIVVTESNTGAPLTMTFDREAMVVAETLPVSPK